MAEKPLTEQQKQIERADELRRQLEQVKDGHDGHIETEAPVRKSLREQIEERVAKKQSPKQSDGQY
jgi:hypothetical protein